MAPKPAKPKPAPKPEVGTIPITITIVGGDGDKMQMKVARKVDIAAIKGRIKQEYGFELHEQLVLFRGRRQTDDMVQPLNTPELEDFIKESGEDGLQMAVVNRPFKLQKFLQDEDLEEVNSKKKSGATVLHRAIRRCEVGLVAEILENEEFSESTLNSRDHAGFTALHTAASMGLRECCIWLLEKGPYSMVSSRNKEGYTALHMAAIDGDHILCKALVEHPLFKPEHAKLKDKVHSYTALQYAEQRGNDLAAEVIRNFCPPDAAPAADAAPAPVASSEAEMAATADSVATAASPAAPLATPESETVGMGETATSNCGGAEEAPKPKKFPLRRDRDFQLQGVAEEEAQAAAPEGEATASAAATADDPRREEAPEIADSSAAAATAEDPRRDEAPEASPADAASADDPRRKEMPDGDFSEGA